jgi:hypothetical protein
MDPQQPVRVKVYGIFSVTKSKYIAQVAMTVIIAVALFFAWQSFPRVTGPNTPPEIAQIMWWVDRALYLIGAILCLVAIEAYFVFRAFARKEAEQQAELAKQAEKKTEPPAVEKETAAPPPASEPAPLADAEAKSETPAAS